MIGQTLSHYRITAAIGTGGMGEVYRATDTTLGRDVAIKVLPPEVAQDPERLARFQREARLLATLNHPNIAGIHGLEEADGKPFLVLELVEGEDLRQRLSRGPLPVDEAIEIAEQIAEALEEAHAKGIVHRDLKPANVKLTPEGKVKVLDFGLAKAWAGDAPNGSTSPAALTQSPTLAQTGTVAGVILGTAGYMAPEQARGKPVDKRADVWSFGVLLWEMLTGRALFDGETVTDVIAAVMTQVPDIDAVPKTTPQAVRRLISQCLRKDPRTRLPDIGAARLELQDLRAGTTLEATPPLDGVGEARAERRSRSRERWAWAIAFLGAAGLAAFFGYRHLPEARAPQPPVHFVLDTPDGLSFAGIEPLALSPDGRHLAIVGTPPGGSQQLWMRSLDSTDVRPLPGTEGAAAPFWSPDSTELAFDANNELRKLVLASGTVQRICPLPAPLFAGGTWSAEGTIVFATGGIGARLYTVSQAGGEAKPLTSLDASQRETGQWEPRFLPDGRHILFTLAGLAQGSRLTVTSLDAPAERRLIRPETGRSQYVAPGTLLFVQNGVLLAQRFDPSKLVTMGDPVPIATSVASWFQQPTWGWFSASATDRLAWVSGDTVSTQIVWVDRKGHQVATLGEPGRYGQILLSPDDKRVVVELADADSHYDLWVIDVARGVPTRLTTDPADDRDPVWSPDSREIVYSSDAGGDQNLLRRGLNGSEAPVPLPRGIGQTPGDRDVAKAWLPQGNTLLYLTIGTERTLWEASLDGKAPPTPLMKGFNVDQPRISPDGRWLAYISQESGDYEVYVQPFGRQGERVRVSANGGMQPRWRGDGRELFFLSPDRTLMAVSVRAEGTSIEVGLPSMLVAAKDLQAVIEGPDYSDYAVTSDGQRFLVKRPAGGGERPRIHVLLGWPALLDGSR